MRTRMLTVLALTTALAGTASAQTAPRNAFTIQPESRIAVEGGSTLRDWSCQAEAIDGAVLTDDTMLTIQRAAAAASATLTIEVAKLECGNGTMNEHMRKALKAGTSPRIMFRFRQLQSTGAAARIMGDLTIAGETRPVTLAGELVEEAGGALRLRGAHEFKMTGFGVAPPRLMVGTLKVHDPVTVTFDVLFRQ